MSRTRVARLVVVFALVGMAAGYFFSQSAEAASTVFSVRVNPGATSHLNCTWHGTCGTTPTAGTSLDWRGSGGTGAYFRGWNYRSDTGSLLSVGTVTTSDTSDKCKQVRATVKNNLGSVAGYVYFTHTTLSGTSPFTLYGDDDLHYQVNQVATIASSEILGCPWTAAHLHQQKSSAWTYQSTNYLTGGSTSHNTYPIYGVNDWQYYKSWVY